MYSILRGICSRSRNTFKSIQNVTIQQNISNVSHNKQTTNAFALISCNLQSIRSKTKKSKIPQQEVTETESEGKSNDETFENIQDKHSKVTTISVPGLRVDSVLKNALGISRNKVDLMFYENKIRINGEKLTKKSVLVNEGDDVDLVKSICPVNPDNIIVARVEILSSRQEDDKFKLKIRKTKTLTVENYPGSNAFK